MQAEPQQQHAWLQKLVGDWTYEGECVTAPGEPPMTAGGTETVRALGELWVLGEGHGTIPGGGPATMLITLGYDPAKDRFVGSWIGSMMSNFWVYDGELDASGKILTLSADGPSMSGDGTNQLYQDIIEIVSVDHRILRAQVQNADGSWNQFMTTHYRRKA